MLTEYLLFYKQDHPYNENEQFVRVSVYEDESIPRRTITYPTESEALRAFNDILSGWIEHPEVFYVRRAENGDALYVVDMAGRTRLAWTSLPDNFVSPVPGPDFLRYRFPGEPNHEHFIRTTLVERLEIRDRGIEFVLITGSIVFIGDRALRHSPTREEILALHQEIQIRRTQETAFALVGHHPHHVGPRGIGRIASMSRNPGDFFLPQLILQWLLPR